MHETNNHLIPDQLRPGSTTPLSTSVFQGVLVDMLLGQTEDKEEEDRVEPERRSM